MADLFSSLKLGNLVLPNRIIMAPLTRMRSQQPGNIPNELNAEYYAQRASAGLIISEATQISQQGQGYPATPGIHSGEQIVGWKKVTDSVHKANGKIFLQLWHVGRISHSSFQADAAVPVAPSAIRPSGMVLAADWKQVPFETPRALSEKEIDDIIIDYRKTAENAKQAGFDGVEIHSANGYLLDQFLHDGSNHRTDNYGGSIENRARFLLKVVDVVCEVWGKDKVGVRLSPYGTFDDMHDSDPFALFSYVLEQLSQKSIVYVHVIEPRATNAGGGDNDLADESVPNTSALFRKKFNGVFISAGGYNPELAKKAVETGAVDAVAFGRWFISNPDLPDKIRKNLPLTKYNRATFYGGGEKGYTDYK